MSMKKLVIVYRIRATEYILTHLVKKYLRYNITYDAVGVEAGRDVVTVGSFLLPWQV